MSNSPEKAPPGGHVTLFFNVSATTEIQDSLKETIDLPKGWKLLSTRKPAKIAGVTELRYFFVIGAPSDCTAGGYEVTLSVKSGQEQASKKVNVMVEQVRKMEMLVVSQPEFVKEGDTLRIDYLIQNAGNSKETVGIKSSQGKILDIKDSLTLGPQEKINVTVLQIIPSTGHNAWQSATDLTVQMTGGEPAVYQVVTTPVFSSTIKKIDRYFRFPMEVGGGFMSYKIGSRTMMAYQYNVTGRGYLDQKNKHYIDFTARGPNQFNFPALGNYDQYSLEYQYNKRTFVSVGDYVLQLNNLMEFGRFGRGLKLEQQFAKTGYVLFVQKARFYFNQKESFGGKFIYKIGESSNVGVSYTSKHVLRRNDQFWSNLMGVSGTARTKGLILEAELAAGQARFKTDYGVFLRLLLTKKWLNVASNLIYAGKNFYGFYNNSMLISNNIGFNISPKVTLGVSSNFSRVNPSLDETFYSVSPKDRNYTAFLSYQINKRNGFFVYYSSQEREDRQRPSDFHYAEKFGNLTYNHIAEKFTFFYQGRFGRSQNKLVFDNSGKKESYSNLIQPTFRVVRGLWLGGYFEHQHTSKFSANDAIENLFYYGGNAGVNIKRNLYATFLYRNNYAPDELYIKRSFLDVSLLLDLSRHKFTVSGGKSHVPNAQNADQNTLFFTVKYALKLNVPLSRKKNIGIVRGKLTGEGFPKQGNLIQLGNHKFLTDSSGMFAFEGVAPDAYYLSITQNDAKNDGVVPVIKMPLLVGVPADSIRNVEIRMTRTGNVKGKIEFLKPSQNLSSVLSQKPTVLVKLTNGTDSFLTELNDRDEFSFKEMRPGKWTLSAFIPANQDRFVIDDNVREFEIECDKTFNAIFKVHPNQKKIHFSDRNFDVSVKK
ncbi:hypothetical protein [Dyadobacter sp. CY347]|uniref:COG1470 family protein n=1 Tax=Dyadobacter sp. CY347 TaxID=2909336 RepID=UPI001F26D1FC|nr:hypothetical protein [Dyadobacter sp. CY347]MCF2487722.1 hypothetical protein [Dyadobacter sp. CY347]